ncbi:predicted protein [Botrytis cinerea T4]|uniref:Uncharacterized protein n=1 Tax=Botryotinia fuckeliana (strain T4) TaxID=999810 RepID=G2XTD6_BOTF4|nr:predicted protein [Botrytis cinerea T4]
MTSSSPSLLLRREVIGIYKGNFSISAAPTPSATPISARVSIAPL